MHFTSVKRRELNSDLTLKTQCQSWQGETQCQAEVHGTWPTPIPVDWDSGPSFVTASQDPASGVSFPVLERVAKNDVPLTGLKKSRRVRIALCLGAHLGRTQLQKDHKCSCLQSNKNGVSSSVLVPNFDYCTVSPSDTCQPGMHA